MKRFIIKCLINLGIILMCSVLFLKVLASFPNQYSVQSHEVNVIKQIERMQNIDEPKIVIIGGSQCGFGMCSRLINEHFNMPVCNTGTHAGMGLLTQINLFKDYIHKNDIVVVIPEYSNYYFKNKYLGEVANLRILSSTYPAGYKTFSLRQQLYLLQYVPSAFIDARNSQNVLLDTDSPYSKESLNVFGDIECYEKRQFMREKDWTAEQWEHPYLQKEVITVLLKCFQHCEEQEATMLLFPPALKAMDFDANQDFIHTIWKSLEEAQLPIVSYPERYRMEDTLCYDVPGHLCYEGVMIRTKRLIADMDSALRVYNYNTIQP